VKRREFLSVLGGAVAARPLPARAQSIPVVGVLGAASPVPYITAAIADGLRENGYTEGRNVRIAYRWAAGAYDRLPGLADELVRLPADVIATLGTPAARRRAAKDGIGCRLLTRNGHDWTKPPGHGERTARARLALPGSRLEAIIDLARDGHDDCRVRLDRAGIWSGTCERESLQKLRFLTIGPTLGASYFSPR
jgi:hypothetical protein